MREAPRRIDVHNHFTPPAYLAAMREQIIAAIDTDPAPVLQWNPGHAIEEMDRSGVATAVLSLSTPGLWVLDDEARVREITRRSNEYAAGLVRDYPGRFGLFAALPLPDVEGSLAEATYALDELKADGIGILTSYAEKYPGDPAFKPLFAELNRRKAVVFVHPTSPQCCGNSLPGLPPPLLEFMFDVTRAITSLLFAGTFSGVSRDQIHFHARRRYDDPDLRPNQCVWTAPSRVRCHAPAGSHIRNQAALLRHRELE